MEEKEQGGAQQTAPTEEAQTQQGSEGVPKSEQEGLPPEIAKSYEGKSPEELAKMHYELSKKLGEQGQVIGSLKDLVGELRAGRESKKESPFKPQSEYSQQTTRQEPAEQEYNDEDFATVGTTKKLLADFWGKHDQMTQQQTMQMNAIKAQQAHNQMLQIIKEEPLCEGIEKAVEQLMTDNYKYPFQQGQDISPYLANPHLVQKAAISILHDTNKLQEKFGSLRTQPVKATSTEEPSSTKPYGGKEPIELDANSREMQDFLDAVENETGVRPSIKEAEEIIGRGQASVLDGKWTPFRREE